MAKLTSYKLNDICELIRGTKINYRNKTSINKYPIITDVNNIHYYSDTFNRPENTILINFMGKSGCVLKFDKKIFLSQHFYSLHSKDKNYLNEEYLYYYLLNIQDKIYNIRKGTLLTYISMDEIMNLCIHIPNIDEQKAIVEQIKQNNILIQQLKNDIEIIKLNNKKIIKEI